MMDKDKKTKVNKAVLKFLEAIYQSYFLGGFSLIGGRYVLFPNISFQDTPGLDDDDDVGNDWKVK